MARGRADLASQPGGHEPGQWYRLRFIAANGVLAGYVDGKLACSAEDESFGQGQVGLHASDGGAALFDDVRVAPADHVREDFREQTPGKWRDAGGRPIPPRSGGLRPRQARG